MPLRPQQEHLNRIIQSIKTGERIDEIFLYWKPGSGKSTVCSIASQLVEDKKTKLLWVCPRDSLKIQAEGDFAGGHFDVGRKNIRIADNNGDPFRGLEGAVTTYQTIVAKKEAWVDLSRKYNLILILDEFDSLTDDSSWSEPIREMYNNSILRIPMTGTIGRSDRKEISFVPYKDGEIDFTDTDTRKWIVYDTEKALTDGSILPFKAKLIRGSGKYRDKDGIEREFNSFDGNGDQLRTAFQTEYAEQVFTESLSHWEMYRQQRPWSKFLVVSPDIDIAKKYVNWFNARGYRFGIATSDESKNAKETIKRFKKENLFESAYDGLVSVAMIYKGLNVPQCTHMIFLTSVRGIAWCDQALGRIQRRHRDKKEGYLFAPDDPKLRKVLKTLSNGNIESVIYEQTEEEIKNGDFSTEERRTIEALYSNADIQPLEETAHKLTYSEMEQDLRKEITQTINKIINDKCKKIINGKEVIVKTNAVKHRKLLWARIMIQINAGRDEDGKLIKIPVAEMTIKQLEQVEKHLSIYLQ